VKMGWLGDVIGRLQASPAIDYTHARVGQAGETLVPDQDYVRIWLRSARIVEVRRWAQKIHATVHSRFLYVDQAQGQREIVSVIAPDKSFEQLDPRNLDRFIVVNQPLLGPVPFRGELGIEIGLFSVAAADLAKPYLELLSDLTASASVAFLVQVKPFIEPIKRGAELLLYNGANAELEIGLVRTDTSLDAGSIVVARVGKGAVDLREFTLDPDDYRLLGPGGRPVDAFPYMVLGVERLRERDFAKIPDLRQGWEGVRLAAQEGRPDSYISERFGQLRRTILLSPDLVPADRRRIVDALAKELAEAGYGQAVGLEGATPEAVLIPGHVLRDLADVVGGSDEPVSLAEVSRGQLAVETAAFPLRAIEKDGEVVLERALADREAEEVEAEMAAAGLEAATPVPPNVAARVSPRTYELIVRHETGGRTYYEKKMKKCPVWPRGSSGITIGFGYDLGYVNLAEFMRDWSLLDKDARDALVLCLGVHAGKASKAQMLSLLERVKDVVIEWETAEAVFRASTLPKFATLTWQALPNSDRLTNDCFGALVSLTFNRGASFSKTHDPTKDPKDRYHEMRAIRAAMQSADFAAIPAQIRAMKRIWLGTAIETEMTRRRNNEAAAFEAGLAAMPTAALTGATQVAGAAGLEAAKRIAVGSSGVIPPDADAWTGAGDEDFWADKGENEASAEAARPGPALESALEGTIARWALDSESPDYAHLGPCLLCGVAFSLVPEDLALLAELNDFPVTEAGDTPILFGLRGCGIIKDHAGSSREVTLKDDRPDHLRPRCVLGVWDRLQGRILVYPGSTVPDARAVASFFGSGRAGNLLPTGLYRYIVGPHVTSKSRPGCFLLRKTLTEKRVVVVRRSRDDLSYTDRDLVDPCMPGDNIHPTFFSQPIGFSSFGCQTVVGTADEGGNHKGPWSEFRKAAGLVDADGEPGKPYLYMLLTGAEARLASEMRRAGLACDPISRMKLRRLRFGSKSEAVRALQARLGFGNPDGDFGRATSERLYARQRIIPPQGRSDGILTPELDEALGWGVVVPAVA
jgi:hypothetical protein